MKRTFSSVLFSVLFLVSIFSLQAFSQSRIDGGSGALTSSRHALQAVVSFDLESVTQNTLNTLVAQGNQTLAENGYVQEAQQYQSEWDNHYAAYFTSFEIFDVGDHQPLNAWLADYYKKLQNKLGDPILRLVHLDDLNTMNYAIPVVFQPKGDKRNGDHWDSVEYSRHFVPFVSIVGYWAAYVGCRAATKAHPALKRFCGTAATTVKTLVKSTVAPKLSKVVYQKATGHPFEDMTASMNQYDVTASKKIGDLAATPE